MVNKVIGNIVERLIARCTINNKTGCWEWNGSKNRGGYGRLMTGSRTDGSRKVASAHRMAYLVFIGDIPGGMEVCHTCDNRKCINPEHLFIGTRQDNIDDRERKGRNIVKQGEASPRAKLTEKDVIVLRQRKAQEDISFRELAIEYKVSKGTIQSAVSGENWKCVKYMPKRTGSEPRKAPGAEG